MIRRKPAVTLLLTLLLGIGLLTMSGCASGLGGPGGPVVLASGNLRAEDRPVQGFTKVELAGFGTLTVTQSGTESLKVEADDNILPLLTSEVRGSTLVLGIQPGTTIQNARVSYTVTVRQLDGVKINGSGKATLVDIATPSLTVDVSGSGDVSSAGRADQTKVDISGSGSYDGSATTTKAANVGLSGSGSAVVQVSETLDADVSGSGTVEYIGNPQVSKDVSGSGSVRKRG